MLVQFAVPTIRPGFRPDQIDVPVVIKNSLNNQIIFFKRALLPCYRNRELSHDR